MSSSKNDPSHMFKSLLLGTVPERSNEIEALWSKYNLRFRLCASSQDVKLDATADRIAFNTKTIDLFWLIGYSGWRAIECYSPHVLLSPVRKKKIVHLMELDEELPEVERDYKERRASVRSLMRARDTCEISWPPDVPHPTADRSSLDGCQEKAAFDLTCFAVSFAMLHEIHHVVLDSEKKRPEERREEEMACDEWARSFMLEELKHYAEKHGKEYQDVLRIRSMGLALAALTLHDITPELEHGGNQEYPPLADRLRTILCKTALAENDHFWVLASSLLLGIFRQRHLSVDVEPMNAKELTATLLAKL